MTEEPAGERIARLERENTNLRLEMVVRDSDNEDCMLAVTKAAHVKSQRDAAKLEAVTQAAEKLSLELEACKARLKECEEGRSK